MAEYINKDKLPDLSLQKVLVCAESQAVMEEQNGCTDAH